MDYKDRRICIGYPSPDRISAQFTTALFEMATQTMGILGAQVGLANAIGSVIPVNRCEIVKTARLMGATDLLTIDTDSLFPIHALAKLLQHDKDIICATTCSRILTSRTPIGVPLDTSTLTPFQKLVPMKMVGFPFMLTKMSVFDKLDEFYGAQAKPYYAHPPRWAFPEITTCNYEIVGEDEYFCHRVLGAGMEILCDMELSMEVGHLGNTINYIENAVNNTPAKIDFTLGSGGHTSEEENDHRAQDGIGE